MQNPTAHLEQQVIPSININTIENDRLFDRASPVTTSPFTSQVIIKIVFLPLRSLILGTKREAKVQPRKIIDPIKPICAPVAHLRSSV